MELDCLLIYVPKLNSYYRLYGNCIFGMFMPMGLLAIADIVRQEGYKVQILHLGIEKIENPKFSLRDYLEKTKPKVVGLSLHWHHQSYDSVEIAKKIKLINSNIFIVFGGFTASFFHQEIIEKFDFIDGVIRGDGESPFLKLTKTILNNNQDFYNVPNLTWRDKNRIVINEINYVAEGQDLDRLNFTNFSLIRNYELYMEYATTPWYWIKGLNKKINLKLLNIGVKGNIFPLSISRGCYVNCSFCGGAKLSQKIICKRSNVVFRSIEKVIESIREAKKYGYDIIFFDYFPSENNSFYFEKLFNEIKNQKIEIGCIAECRVLPSQDILGLFSKTFVLSKSKINLSPESGAEEIRRLNKGYYFSNQELIETISYMSNLGIRTEIFFSLGLPFQNSYTLKITKNFQDFLKKEFEDSLTIRTEPLQLDPASPMYIEPEKYNIVKNWDSFMDFYYTHGNKNNLCIPIYGYYLQGFCKKNNFVGLTEVRIFTSEIEKIMCKDFCSLTNLLLNNFKKIGLRLPVRLVSMFSNLFCNLMSYLWKYREKCFFIN